MLGNYEALSLAHLESGLLQQRGESLGLSGVSLTEWACFSFSERCRLKTQGGEPLRKTPTVTSSFYRDTYAHT